MQGQSAQQDCNTSGKLACFLDGASLNVMQETLGLGKIHFPSLRNILSTRIGRGLPFLEDPVITVGTAHINHLGNILLKSKFSPIAADSFQKQDDQVLIDKIRAVKKAEVSKIIVVTSDKDLLPCLLAKANEGIRILWVAVMSLADRDGSFGVGREVRAHFGKEIVGVPLEKYGQEITFKQDSTPTSRCSRRQLLHRFR